MNPLMQISEVSVKVCFVGWPRQSIHLRGGIAFEREERHPQAVDADVVEECGEPLLLPLPCGLPYALQRLCHALPSLCPVRALLARVPLGPALGCSAAVGTALFVGFTAIMAESDFSRPCITGYGSSPSRCGPTAVAERSSARSPGSRARSVCTCQGL